MKFRIIFIIVASMAFGIYHISSRYAFRQNSEQLKAIRAMLDPGLEKRPCVNEGPFPFSTMHGRRDYGNSMTYHCTNCDMLYKAGLLTKEVIEHDVPPSKEHPDGDVAFEVYYDLTDLGRELYTEGSSNSPHETNPHRFCIGKAKVYQFTRTVGPRSIGNVNYLTVRYIAVLEDPHPYLNDPRAKLLGIKLPSGNPPLYPESYTTAVFLPNSDKFKLDSSIEILY